MSIPAADDNLLSYLDKRVQQGWGFWSVQDHAILSSASGATVCWVTALVLTSVMPQAGELADMVRAIACCRMAHDAGLIEHYCVCKTEASWAE